MLTFVTVAPKSWPESGVMVMGLMAMMALFGESSSMVYNRKFSRMMRENAVKRRFYL